MVIAGVDTFLTMVVAKNSLSNNGPVRCGYKRPRAATKVCLETPTFKL